MYAIFARWCALLPFLCVHSFVAAGAADVRVQEKFADGRAGALSFNTLADAGVFVRYPMKGGVYQRNEQVRYIVLHSTETASPADAKRVIRSWSNRGLSHPGTPFVIDRDGTIYATSSPDLATVHLNIKKTLPGFNNDNSVGIEMVRSGTQKYTSAQLKSVERLVAYLQDHYGVPDANVTTHGTVQPGDRSDPVNFDFNRFVIAKRQLGESVMAVTPESVPLPSRAPDFRRFSEVVPRVAPAFLAMPENIP